jgi:hypothetical protein
VQIAERWIIAALRHRKFFSLTELNLAIGELLEKLNQRPFKKREGSRRRLFLEIEQPALRPPPTERFDLSVWSASQGEHRLSHSVRCELLWRALFAGAPDGGGSRYTDNHRDLPQGTTRGFPSARPQALHGGDQLRASPGLASCAPSQESIRTMG